MAILTLDTQRLEPLVEFLSEPSDIRKPTGAESRVAKVRTGTVPCCEQVTMGGYGARPKKARTTGYYGYTSVPTDVVHANQATVSGCIGWTGQASATGYRESGEHLERTVSDGRCTRVDAAGVAGSIIDTTGWTPSIWAGVEPAKLYTGVGPSDSDSGIAEVLRPAYYGQLTQM